MAPATLYTVNGPRGTYFAVRNHQTGKVWTERTEAAAVRQAADEQLAIVAGETIGHSQLLDMMIADGLATYHGASDPSAASSANASGGLSRFFKLFHRH
ncbi:MAG TPA: hypothetical protein VFE47_11290 [Tepidisphaeraceae bacterium]|nr:hypothetical protein [Tepidisphaeraceae bacterium]